MREEGMRRRGGTPRGGSYRDEGRGMRRDFHIFFRSQKKPKP
jgi:hypothetical protein